MKNFLIPALALIFIGNCCTYLIGGKSRYVFRFRSFDCINRVKV